MRVQAGRLARDRRYGMAALARDPQVRAQIKAENVARIFLKSLRTQYGENAVLELVDGPDDKNWKLAGEPIDEEIVNVDVRRVEDRTVMNLIDPQTGVGISNVMTWTDEKDMRHAVVSLDQLWVHAAGGIVSDPATRQLYDGRVVVQIAEDDDSVKYVVLGASTYLCCTCGHARAPALAIELSMGSGGVGAGRALGTPQSVARRARVILLAAEGHSMCRSRGRWGWGAQR